MIRKQRELFNQLKNLEMKKILIGFALGFATLSFAQQYPNGNGGYNDYGNNGYYDNNQNYNNFPDDYYYNYPQDYYPQDYYQSYYNDYRNSIVNVNWNVFFNQYRLSPWQISQINALNNLYINFSSWNSYYGPNPDRWYYDRFYALENILGPSLFIVFQNNYYNGMRPVVYFQDYRRTYYAPRYRVMAPYRNININVYRVDRSRFRPQDNPMMRIARSNNGFRTENNHASGGFRNTNGTRPDNNGVRPNNGNFNNGGFRNNGNNNGFGGNRADNVRPSNPRNDNGGTRSEGGFRSPSRNDNGGFRNQSSPQQPRQNNDNRGGFRNNFAKN